MSRAKGKVQPDINTEIRRLQRTLAVLVCIQAAAAEGTDADLGDALTVVVALVSESLAALDRLEALS
jgi:hypothetical protein